MHAFGMHTPSISLSINGPAPSLQLERTAEGRQAAAAIIDARTIV